jgi:hypothetical protein
MIIKYKILNFIFFFTKKKIFKFHIALYGYKDKIKLY